MLTLLLSILATPLHRTPGRVPLGERRRSRRGRVGPADVAGGRNSDFGREVEDPPTGCGPNANALVCCLKVCETEFYGCIQGIYHTCASSGDKKPFEYPIDFKCCTLDCLDNVLCDAICA